MHFARWAVWLGRGTAALLLLLSSCSGTGQSGTEGSQIRCGVRGAERRLGLDERVVVRADGGRNRPADVAVEGHSPADLAALIETSADLPFVWLGTPGAGLSDPQRHQTSLHLRLTTDLTTALQVEWSDAHYDIMCPNSIEIAAFVDFESLDGAFVERLSGTLQQKEEVGVTFSVELPARELRGTFDDSAYPASVRQAPYSVQLRWGSSNPLASTLSMSVDVWQGGASIAHSTDP